MTPDTLPETRPTQDTALRLAETAVLQPMDRVAAEPPPALVLCWHCSAVAEHPDPPGWVTAHLSEDLGMRYGYGVCPACLNSVYEFTTED